MKKIENILKLIPLFSFLLIVASSVKLAVFYKIFNINIVDYLSISEYIPLFIDDLHSLLYIGSGILLGTMIGETKKKDEKNEDKEKEKKSLRSTYIVYVIFLVVIAPIIIFLRYDSWYDRLRPVGLIFFILMLSIAILYSSYREKNVSIRHAVGWIFFLLTVPVVISGYIDAYKIIENKRNVIYEISIDGKVFNQGNHHTFIGKSNDFIFLYNDCTNNSIVYPMDKVEKINIIKIPK